MRVEEVCEAEQEPGSAKSSPEGGKEIILQFLQVLWDVTLQEFLGSCHICTCNGLAWIGVQMCLGRNYVQSPASLRVLALETAESEYMFLGECGQSGEGELGGVRLDLMYVSVWI